MTRIRGIAGPALALVGTLAAGAAAAACGGADGGVEGGLGRVDLTAGERALVEERFASDFIEAAQVGLAADALFRFARCELNGAEPAELVALGRSPAHCIGITEGAGAPICGVWVLTRSPDGWVEVLETAGRPRLSESITNGWRDVVVERGAEPAVWKFGGAAYQEELGAADPLGDPLEDWGGYGVAQDDIAWFAFDDPMPAEAEAAFLWFWSRAMADEGIEALPDGFRVGVAELDREAPEEAVIHGIDRALCSTAGCRHWVLSDLDAEAPRIVGRLTGFDLRAAATGGAGGRDLVTEGPEGLSVWRNDGNGWGRAGLD